MNFGICDFSCLRARISACGFWRLWQLPYSVQQKVVAIRPLALINEDLNAYNAFSMASVLNATQPNTCYMGHVGE